MKVSAIDYRVISETLVSLDCSKSLAIFLLFRAGQFEDIVNMNFNPYDYNDLDTARRSLCAVELLSKNRFLLIDNINTKSVAFLKFAASEAQCSATNERLRVGNPRFESILFRIQRKIADILGEFDLDEMIDRSGWGPGVTLTLRGGDHTLFRKFQHDVETTTTFDPIARRLVEALSPHWRPRFRQFEGNRVITVPKNAKTDRVIAVEPSINLFFQKGIGCMISSRLKRWNVDLNDQTVNQRLSERGSFDNSLATVDFSAASDTIAYNLVMDLLPWKWFLVLDSLRSSRGLVGDSLIEYEKFSSMGNGFTFELESLIFFATAVAVCEEVDVPTSSVSVYGDDVIIPAQCYQLFSEVSSYLGFTVNLKKSYSSSYFRESCGSYFWNGVNIKPIRLLESCQTKNGLISFHNRLFEFDSNEAFPALFEGLRRLIISSYPDKNRVPITPPSFMDKGFMSLTPPKGSWKDHFYTFLSRSFESERELSEGHCVLLAHLWHGRDRSDLVTVDNYRYQEWRLTALMPFGNECDIPRRGRFRTVRSTNLSTWC